MQRNMLGFFQDDILSTPGWPYPPQHKTSFCTPPALQRVQLKAALRAWCNDCQHAEVSNPFRLHGLSPQHDAPHMSARGASECSHQRESFSRLGSHEVFCRSSLNWKRPHVQAPSSQSPNPGMKLAGPHQAKSPKRTALLCSQFLALVVPTW